VNNFAGTFTLTRFALRRDRILLPIWIALFPLLTVSSASATVALYPTEQSRVVAAGAINELPVAVALYGRIWDPTSLGALSLLKLAAMGGVMIGILAIMLVTRHVRAEEEQGRTELLGAAAVGRWAQLSAAMLVTAMAMLAIAVISGIGLAAIGLPAGGSFVFGFAWAVTGMAFAAIAAVSNQLTVSARAATGLAMIALAVAYVLRAIGDVGGDDQSPGSLSWLSPIGWGQQVRPYAGDRAVVLVIPIIFSMLVICAAFILQSRRDLGGGLIPDRSGAADASPRFSTPAALAWRLQYPMLLGWAGAYVVLSGIVGSIVNDLSGMLDTPQARQMIESLGGSRNMMDAFVAMEFSVIAFITAAFGIVAARRLASEEALGHTESILATAVSRARFVFSHLSVAIVGTFALTLIQGVVFALASASQSGTTDRIGATVAASLVYLPAVWFMTSVVIAIFGFVPRLTFIAWVLLVSFLVIAELGALLSWPQWVMNASPFAHISKLPGASLDWAPMVILSALALIFIVVGTMRFHNRDLETA